MTTQTKGNIRRYIAANIWVIIVDIAGALLLLSLLLTAAGSSALKEWMFVMLTFVPVMAAVTVLASCPAKQNQANIPAARPVQHRKIIISPRPFDKRANQAV